MTSKQGPWAILQIFWKILARKLAVAWAEVSKTQTKTFPLYNKLKFPLYFALKDATKIRCFKMVKTRELTESERVATKYLHETGHSFSEIVKQVGCSKSRAFKVYKRIQKTWSIEKQPRSGRPRKFLKRGESRLSGCWTVKICNFGGAEVDSFALFWIKMMLITLIYVSSSYWMRSWLSNKAINHDMVGGFSALLHSSRPPLHAA